MKTLARAVGLPRRTLFLLAIGIGGGLLEALAREAGLDGSGGVFLPGALFATALGVGMALEAGIPTGRLTQIIGFSVAGALGDALFSPVSAALGRALLGAGIGAAVIGPGPLHPAPAIGALKGAIGACVAAPIVLLLGVRGAPTILLPGVEALVIGIFLSQGRAERLLAALAVELDAIRRRGSEELRTRADRLVALAVEAVNEVDAHEERTGEDLARGRAEIAAVARRALGLLRRLAAAPDVTLVTAVAERLDQAERELEGIYRRELGFVLEGK